MFNFILFSEEHLFSFPEPLSFSSVCILSSPFSSSSWCFPHLPTCSFPFRYLPSSFLIYSAFISLKTKKKHQQPNKEETKGHSGLNYITYYSMKFNLFIRRKILEEMTFHTRGRIFLHLCFHLQNMYLDLHLWNFNLAYLFSLTK